MSLQEFERKATSFKMSSHFDSHFCDIFSNAQSQLLDSHPRKKTKLPTKCHGRLVANSCGSFSSAEMPLDSPETRFHLTPLDSPSRLDIQS